MSLNKFKNVKWDHKRQFKKSLAKFNLSNEAFELIDIASDNNILVTIFNSLLRENKLDHHQSTSNTNLIKLYSALQIVNIFDDERKEKLSKEINKTISKLDEHKRNKNLKKINFESSLLKGYKVSNEEKKLYFSSNDYYEKIGEVFEEPFDDQRYYDFAYQLAMYVKLELTFNQFNTPENTDIFLIKLEVQQKMIDSLSRITPENFNTILINLNKWFKKYDKKFVRFSNRKLGD